MSLKEDLMAEQKRLRRLGLYHDRVDGSFGTNTLRAFSTGIDRLEALLSPVNPVPSGMTHPSVNYLTALELGCHEAVIRRAYRDSADVWTWSVGLTSATGHDVERYINNPQPMQYCLDVYVWALRNYSRQVDKEFEGHNLTQNQYDGAVSFHWNTGAIRKATWVTHFKNGDHETAELSFRTWDKSNGKTVEGLRKRREAEADLIWRNMYSNDGTITEFTRLTAGHHPIWSSGVRRNVRVEMMRAFGQSVEPILDTAPNLASVPTVPTLTTSTFKLPS